MKHLLNKSEYIPGIKESLIKEDECNSVKLNNNKIKYMKKLLIVLVSLFFAFSMNAQEGPKEIFKINHKV